LAIHPDATIDERAVVHESAVIWAGTHVREYAEIGSGTSLGQYAYVGPGAVIGADCKIQNGAMIYEPAIVADGVFIGPRVIFTNDRHPRAITPDGARKSADDWTAVGVVVDYGASIGAGAICVAPVVIGAWSTVAAGAVVTRDVPPHALVAGVPARRIGWVGRTGELLVSQSSYLVCPATGERFIETTDGIESVDE